VEEGSVILVGVAAVLAVAARFLFQWEREWSFHASKVVPL
jgi:hypothetical protein